jgi:ribose-phosphate pyrophosphokinase
MSIAKFNLTNPMDSDIKFKISRFPDGQQTVDIESSAMYINGLNVKIYSRMNSFRDIELIIAANQALREMAVGSVTLYVPYFLGARSDRKFQQGGTNYLKQVICPIINSQKFDAVIVLDPHSDVLEACLNNYEKIDNHTIVKYSLTDIDNRDGAQDRIVLVSPDAGAYKKIFDVAKEFGIDNIITANKVRDLKTGKILRTEVPTLDQHKDLKYVIVDDICDGGRTFVELAKAIKGSRPTAKVYLIVTHGIFSSGFSELDKYFTKIFTTNSYREITKGKEVDENGNCGYLTTKFDGFAQSGDIAKADLLTQFNVF